MKYESFYVLMTNPSLCVYLVKLRALYNITAKGISLNTPICTCSDLRCAGFGTRNSSAKAVLLQRPCALYGSQACPLFKVSWRNHLGISHIYAFTNIGETKSGCPRVEQKKAEEGMDEGSRYSELNTGTRNLKT